MTTRTLAAINRDIASIEKAIEKALHNGVPASKIDVMYHNIVVLRKERIKTKVKSRSTSTLKKGSTRGGIKHTTVSAIDRYSEHKDIDDWGIKEAGDIKSLAQARQIFNILSTKTDNKVYALADLIDRGSSASEGAVTAAVNSGIPERLQAIIDRRVNDPIFVAALGFRNEQRVAYRSTKHAFVYLKAIRDNKTVECTDKDSAEKVTPEEIRDTAHINLDEYERLHFLNEYISRYKAVTARAVARLEDILIAQDIENGTADFYEEETLNGLVALGSYESGSREWLESRQGGIGGSDVGAIMRVDPDFAYENYKAIFESKTEEISEEQVNLQYGEDFTTATGRGNAWEESILRKFISKNPEESVVRCKTSWSASWLWKHMYANFDGLLRHPETGEIDGIVEIKTASDPSKWGPTYLGIDGVPEQYRKQVLWYMMAAGLTRGVILVIIDDREYREYWFSINATLAQEQDDIFQACKDFWNKVESCRANPELFNTPRRMSIPQAAYRAPDWSHEKRRTLANNIAAYRDVKVSELDTIHEEIASRIPEWEESVRALYSEFHPANRQRPLIGIDLETSGFAPQMGRIIELGASVWEYDESQENNYREVKKISRLYGLPRKAEESTGTGMVDVHHITVDDVKGKPLFGNPKNQKELLELFKTGILVFHNATFEHGWFMVHLEGYAEAYANGEIAVLDTMLVSRHLFGHLETTKNHKLQALVERYGDEYVNAHRAYADVLMMLTALSKVEQELQGIITVEI